MRLMCSLLLLLLLSGAKAQRFDSLCMQQQQVMATLLNYHFSPPALTQTVKLQLLDGYIKEADERNILFLQADREKLAQVLADSSGIAWCSLIAESYRIVRKRMKQVDSILTLIEGRSLQFSSKDTIYFIRTKQPRLLPQDLAALARRLEKRIKYECLLDILSPRKDGFDALKLKPAEVAELTESAKKKSLKHLRRFLDEHRQPRKLGIYLADCLANATALRFDPHSNYFNPFQMQNYHNLLSASDVSYGFSVKEDAGGQVVIGELVPGGPAWKSNSLNEGDAIIAFTFEGAKEVEIDNWELDYFYDTFYQSASGTVELKVRKKDLKIMTVKLEKEKIQSQENAMNSYLVNYKGRKMGYIPVPSFYLDEEEDSRQGCANDVAKEIIELKRDSIAGLILDLRYNGGGSMREAMGLSGIFINEGPVAVCSMRGGKPFFLKDLNRGTIWDGPLVILVNSASASASEFVAASLQDYNRAVIAGSRTYGKGTAQIVVPADSQAYNSNTRRLKAEGYLKVTNGKFYRLSGESHQGKGIQPDVKIPGIIEKVMETESDQDFFLPNDSAGKKAVYNKLPPLPLEKLARQSAQRIAAIPSFATITRLGDSLKLARRHDDKVVLDLKGMKAYLDRQRSLERRVDEIFVHEDKALQITNSTENEKVISFSEYHRRATDHALNVLRKDLILHEGLGVLSDLVDDTSK